jgi:hypothetical protein
MVQIGTLRQAADALLESTGAGKCMFAGEERRKEISEVTEVIRKSSMYQSDLRVETNEP